MNIPRRAALIFCSAAISLLAACGGDSSVGGTGAIGGGGTPPPPVIAPVVATLVSIAITPPVVSIDTAGTRQFVATGTFSDGTTADLSSTVTWKVSSTPTAAITAAGIASGVDAGTSTVTASAGSVVSNAAALEVTPTVWKSAGLLKGPRVTHKAVLLPSGKVLAAGGSTNAVTAELYDPATNEWTATGSMINSRQHLGMLLLKTGEVLAFAGNDEIAGADNYLVKTELYNPVTGTWRPAADMNAGRRFHAASLLNDGRVIVSGGANSSGSVSTVEIYDPAGGTTGTGGWTVVAPQIFTRVFHTATLLNDGRVLVAGGVRFDGRTATAELYNPATNSWSLTSNPMAEQRQQHAATILKDGKVMVVGGRTTQGSNFWTANSEIFDPATQTWTQGPTMADQKSVHTATLMPNGSVVVVGGENPSGPGGALVALAKSSTLSRTGGATVEKNTLQVRIFSATVLLQNGRLLAIGGGEQAGAITSAEIL